VEAVKSIKNAAAQRKDEALGRMNGKEIMADTRPQSFKNVESVTNKVTKDAITKVTNKVAITTKKVTKAAINEAATIITKGGLVAIPTETVYGLGADATNPAAVARIYAAKGRPGDNPLILHIASSDQFSELADNPAPYAYKLMKYFWPGPLTLVVNKKPGLPAWLGCHPEREARTIGIRMPAHPVALSVIEASGCVVAAPSANKAGTPSPTTASHVASDFADGSIDYILDGDAVSCGLESTVVDVTGGVPVILRPGAITAQMITDATGLNAKIASLTKDGTAPLSPGMKYRHYAPKAPMTLLMGSEKDIAAYIIKECECAKDKNRIIGILATTELAALLNEDALPAVASITEVSVSDASSEISISDVPAAETISSAHLLILGHKSDYETIAKNLYANLRQFDTLGVDIIYAQGITLEGFGIAIMDRMKKAAEGRVVHVSD